MIDAAGTYSVETAASSDTADIVLWAHPFPGARPVFYLEDTAGQRHLTTDPYALSPKPYDGKSKYLGLLGFAATASASIAGSRDLADALSAFPDLFLGGQAPAVTVR